MLTHFFGLPGGGKEALNMDLEIGVLDYLLDERTAGRPVNNRDLQDKAREIARDIEGLEDFKGSDGWLTRWKKRNAVGIWRGTNESQKLPEDYANLITDFKQVINRHRVRHDYTLSNIGNMDQPCVGLIWHQMSPTMCRGSEIFASQQPEVPREGSLLRYAQLLMARNCRHFSCSRKGGMG